MSAMRWKSASASSTVFPAVGQCGTCVSINAGGHRGYMERPYLNRGGRTYVQRTYYVGGRSYVYAYRTYYYGGAPYYGYAPAYYYQPVYYGWAYNPWPAPAYYRWGYYNDPWYGNYNYYYQPYPAYPSSSPWLTDYILSENLRAAYEASLAGKASPLRAPFNQSEDLTASLWSSDSLIAGDLDAAYGAALYMSAGKESGSASQAQLSPEVKQALAEEVKQQIAADKSSAETSQQAASKGDELPPALDPKHRIFVASSNLDVTTTDGTEGEVIFLSGTKRDLLRLTIWKPLPPNVVTAFQICRKIHPLSIRRPASVHTRPFGPHLTPAGTTIERHDPARQQAGGIHPGNEYPL